MGRVSLLDDVCCCAGTTQRLSRGMLRRVAQAAAPGHVAWERRQPRRGCASDHHASRVGARARQPQAAPGNQHTTSGHAGGTARRDGSRQASRPRATPDEPTAGMGPRRGRGYAGAVPGPQRARVAGVRAQGSCRARPRTTPGPQANRPHPTRRAGSRIEAAHGVGPRRARPAEAAPRTPRSRARAGAARPCRGRAEWGRLAGPRRRLPRPSRQAAGGSW
jgi:hypothetical protein